MAIANAIKRVGALDYKRCEELLGKKGARTLGPNTTLSRDGASYVVTLYRTPIVTFHPDGRVILNSGGYRTPTTKGRMGELTGMPVYSKRGRWHVGGAEFYDGINVGK